MIVIWLHAQFQVNINNMLVNRILFQEYVHSREIFLSLLKSEIEIRYAGLVNKLSKESFWSKLGSSRI